MNAPMATMQWRETMHIDDLWDGDMAPVEVDGTNVLLVNVDGDIKAYLNRCPHQAWALDEGDFDGQTLTCIRHLWTFDVTDGKGINPDDECLTKFRCHVGEDGMIRVDVG
jgi:toluene monooxygenase system ferredoxin subunit